MGYERTDNNFDIEAIRRATAAMEGAGATDPVTATFASEIEDMIDDLRFNPSTNLAEEAAQVLNSPMAARLDSGVLMNLRAAVNLQEEKQENGSAAFMRGDTWNEQRERDDRDRKEQARVADMIDDAMSNQLSTTPDRYGISQRDYAELNDELKTRDGQDRFMNFLRFAYPNMTDAERVRMVEDAQVVAAVRANEATPDQQQAYDSMSPNRRDQVSRTLGEFHQYKPSVSATSDINVTNMDGSMAGRDLQVRTTYDDGGPVVATTASVAPLPISVASTLNNDVGIGSAPNLSATFRVAASGNPPPDPQPLSPTPAPQGNTQIAALDFGVANM